MAAGFDIRTERLPELRERLREYAVTRLPEEAPVPEIQIDLEIRLAELTSDFMRGYGYLEPFGAANPVPRMAARGVRFRNVETVGADGSHLKGRLEGEGGGVDAIGFWMGDRLPELASGELHDVVFELHVEIGSRGPRTQAHLIAVGDPA